MGRVSEHFVKPLNFDLLSEEMLLSILYPAET